MFANSWQKTYGNGLSITVPWSQGLGRFARLTWWPEQYFKVININKLMLFIFFWKEMSWILFFHLLFSCHKIIFRETSYILLHHGIRNTFTVLGTNTNNFWWRPARKDYACATGTPCQKVTEGFRKQCTVKEVSKYVVRIRCK